MVGQQNFQVPILRSLKDVPSSQGAYILVSAAPEVFACIAVTSNLNLPELDSTRFVHLAVHPPSVSSHSPYVFQLGPHPLTRSAQQSRDPKRPRLDSSIHYFLQDV